MLQKNRWKKIFATVTMVCLVVGILPTKAFAETESGVVLYENGNLVAEYENINAAFNQMTDETAEYEVQLKDSQNLTGYKSWPKAKSITLNIYDPDGTSYGETVLLRLEQLQVAVQSDVHFKNSIQCSYMYTNKIGEFNLQGYDLYVDYTEAGWITSFSHLNIVGEMGSEVILNGSSQLVNGAINVQTVRSNSVYTDYGYSSGYMTFDLEEGVTSHIGDFYGENSLNIEVSGRTENAPFIIDNIYSSNPLIEGEYDGWVSIKSSHEFQISVGNIYAARTTLGLNSYKLSETDVKIMGEVTGTIQVSYTENINNQAKEGDFPKKNTKEAPLFYGPNLEEEQVNITYTVGCHYYEKSFYPYDYSGVLYPIEGYYYAGNIPGVYLDQTFAVISGRREIKIAYEVEDRDKVKSIEWEATYRNMAATTNQIQLSWDEQSLTANVIHYLRNDEYALLMTVTYEDGSIVRVNIPVYMSADLTTELTLDQTVVSFDSYTELSDLILNLSYSSNQKPLILSTSSNPDIVSLVGIDKKARKFKVLGCGKAIVTVYAGEHIAQCEVNVDMPVSEKEVFLPEGAEKQFQYEPYYVTEIPSELDDASIECVDDSIVKIEHTKWGTLQLSALKQGETVIKITYKDYVKEIPVTVGEAAKKGDANGDEQINAEDALTILKYVAKMEQQNFFMNVADCNTDGTIDATDALQILKFVAKIIDSL